MWCVGRRVGAVTAFHATFDVWVGGGSGGDGFAFCYGALAPGSDGGVGRDGRFVGVTKGQAALRHARRRDAGAAVGGARARWRGGALG